MNENFEKDYEFEQLVLMSFDGSISDEEFRQLDDLLGRDSEARKKYFDLLKINQSLCSYTGILAYIPDSIRAGLDGPEAFSAASAMDAIDYPESKRQDDIDNLRRMHLNRNNLFTGFLKIAAVVMISLSVIWFGRSIVVHKPEPSFEKFVSVATLDVVRGVSWDKESEVLQAGDRLFINQDIVFSTGSVRIRFDNNAEVLVQAPVSLRIKGEKLLYLKEGKLTALVPPGVKGFTVLTPVAEVVDYGTEFGVTVDESGKTETSVFKGAVDLSVTNNQGHYKPQRITAGLSRTVDQDSNLADEKFIDETLYIRMGFSVNINFQPAHVEVPKGYTFDDGSAFADRGNGYTYGWSRDIAGKITEKGTLRASRYRKVLIMYDDRRFDTLVHMQKLGELSEQYEGSTWEIEVPNGTYKVDVAMGDSRHIDAINNILIEGVALNDPDGHDHFDTYNDVTVVITDGRLTVKPAPDAYNAKICFINIFQR